MSKSLNNNYSPSFAEKVKFGKGDRVMAYFGKNSFGLEFFCYIRCDLDGYRKMQDDFLNNISATPETYGEVIYKDFIPEPDEKAKEFLKNWTA